MPRTTDVRGEKVFDSRDAISRRDELREERDDIECPPDCRHNDCPLDEWDAENGEELKALEAFISEAEGYGDFSSGETCIREDYFEEYAQELAEDIGAIQRDTSWPNNYIDWAGAADALKVDYTSADLDGFTYWFRS